MVKCKYYFENDNNTFDFFQMPRPISNANNFKIVCGHVYDLQMFLFSNKASVLRY